MKVIIYGKTGCSWCERAKELCEEKGLSYAYFKIGEDITKEEFLQTFDVKTRSSIRSVPQIFVDGLHVGGYDDLYKLLN